MVRNKNGRGHRGIDYDSYILIRLLEYKIVIMELLAINMLIRVKNVQFRGQLEEILPLKQKLKRF